MHQKVNIAKTVSDRPLKGSAGLYTQCMGAAVTVSAVANATGGITVGNIITVSNK